MEQILDVSMLEPCQPLEQSLEAVRTLVAGDFLKITHRREPTPLFPMLEQMGFSWRSRQTGSAQYEILIWRSSDKVAESQVNDLSANAC